MKYTLGTSDVEHRRLEIQAKLLDPYTLRFLVQAGIGEGRTLLDIGTGAGHVALCAAEAVGPTGRVLGVDVEAAMTDHARARAASAGHGNVTFQPTSPLLAEVEETFDIVFARLVLLFQPDKPALLARAAELVRPGGTLAVIDSAWSLPAFWSCPPLDAYDRYMAELISTADRLGIDNNVGARLVALFAEAGLAEPAMSAELVTGGKGSGIVEYNLLNGEVMFDRARAASIACPTTEQEETQRDAVLTAVHEAHSQFFGPCLIGAILRL